MSLIDPLQNNTTPWGDMMMEEDEVLTAMKGERMSLTCAPGGENHAGMEIIGRMPFKGEGFSAEDLRGLKSYFDGVMGEENVELMDLNELSGDEVVGGLKGEDEGVVLVLRKGGMEKIIEKNYDVGMYCDLKDIKWDGEYLDNNKYRSEKINGEKVDMTVILPDGARCGDILKLPLTYDPQRSVTFLVPKRYENKDLYGTVVKVPGQRRNKWARKNICCVAGREQKPAVYEGKGTIVDLNRVGKVDRGVKILKDYMQKGLLGCGSSSKVEINVVEGNRYYDLKKTGIGYHGDTERVVVICFSIGCDNYPLCWQWFKDGHPVGNNMGVKLNSGDVYIMSEKSVGADWKLRSKYTIRHAAGAKKYRSLKKWEDRKRKREGIVEISKKLKSDRVARPVM